MKTLGTVFVIAMLATGCISDNASVTPRTMIRLHRTGSNPAAVASAGQPGGTNTLFQANALTNDPAALGVAPYISQASNAATLSETNSLTGINAPRVTTTTGTVGPSATPGAAFGPGASGSHRPLPGGTDTLASSFRSRGQRTTSSWRTRFLCGLLAMLR